MENLSRHQFIEKFGLAVGTGAAVLAAPSLLEACAGPTSALSGQKLNVALCGLGSYAGLLAEGLLKSKYCRLTGIVTGHLEKAKKWQEKYALNAKNIYNYENFDQIKDNKNIDLVYVVLPKHYLANGVSERRIVKLHDFLRI